MIASIMFKEAVSKKWTFGRKKIILIVLAILVGLLVTVLSVGYVSIANKVQQILPGNLLDVSKSDPLKTTDGRTNILIFGTSYDDPNPSHTGGYLTDSLIVLSVDERAQSVYTMSIPRDLWVDYDTPCTVGESGKINAAYLCALNSAAANDTRKASQLLADKAGSILGLHIHYYLQVNYTFIKSLTDALGGIDVDVYSEDERGIYDPNVGLKLPAGVSHLDGKTALKLARARNAAGGYGLPRSNFDREINQQRIFAAMLKKASASGRLNDVGLALKMIDSLAGQMQTSVQTSELKSAIKAGKSIKMDKIISIPLGDYMTTGTIQGQSVVMPVAGLNMYTDIQSHVASKLQPKGGE